MRSALGVYADGLADPGGGVTLCLSDGTTVPVALKQYLGPADATDLRILSGIRGPVLDVGCGPGRHLQALARRGVFALGVDLSDVAVGLARDGGAAAIVGSIFDEVPAAGRWRTALLLDGNVGIGGAPARLLARVRDLLADTGAVLVELSPPGTDTRALSARLETSSETSAWFRWARVATPEIDAIAAAAGFEVQSRERHGNRWFARLRKRLAEH